MFTHPDPGLGSIKYQVLLNILCVEEEQSFADDNEQQNDAVEIDTYKEDIIQYCKIG
jgi:hypothetical protein